MNMMHQSNMAEAHGCPVPATGQPSASGNQQQQQPQPHAPSFSAHALQSVETEAEVLQCIVQDAAVAFDALDRAGIGSRHFHHFEYRKLFKLAQAMRKARQPMSLQTLLAQARQQLRDPFDPLVLGAMEAHASNPLHSRVSDLPFHITRLKELQTRRELFDFSRRARGIALDPNAPVHTLLVDAYDVFGRVVDQADPEPLSIASAEVIAAASIRENDNLLGDRLLAKGQSLTITGAGGVGKSRLLLQLAACCITGRDFLGLPTFGKDSTWLILQAENSPRRLQQDLHSLRRWLGEEDWQRASQRLFCHTLVHNSDQFMQLDDPLGLSRIRAWIDKLQPDVVCFDPLNCFVSGDLNSDRDMRQFCSEATRLCQTGNPDRAIVVLHHARTGKAGAAQATGYDRSGFARNSKVLYNWTRGQINLAPRGPEDNQRLVVACAKCSNGREFKTFAITLDPRTMIYQLDPEFNVQQWEDKMHSPAPGAEDAAELSMDALLEICATPCTRLEARRQLEKRGFSKANSYKSISRALEENLLLWKNDQLTLPDQGE